MPLVKPTRLLNALPLGGVAAGPGASGPGPSALAALRPLPSGDPLALNSGAGSGSCGRRGSAGPGAAAHT